MGDKGMGGMLNDIKSIEFTFNNQEFQLLPVNVQHTSDLVAAITDSLDQLKKFMPWAHSAMTIDKEFQFRRLVKAQHDFYLGDEYLFHLYQNHRFVGSYGLHRRALSATALEIGYWISSPFAGQGITTHTCKILINFCFETLQCTRVQCGYNASNIASKKVNDKLELPKEGCLVGFEGLPQELLANGASVDTIMTAVTRDGLSSLSWWQAGDHRYQVNYLGVLNQPAGN